MDPAQVEYIRKQNEKEAAERAGKPPEPAPVVVATLPNDDDDDDSKGGSPDPQRSARRRERGLVERAAKAEARAELLQELLDKGMTHEAANEAIEVAKGNADPEPVRKDFPDDAAYYRALGRWDARQETAKALGERDKQTDQQRQNEQVFEEIRQAREKAQEDKKLVPNWDTLQAKAAQMEEEGILPTLEGRIFLSTRLAASDVQVFLYAYFIDHPEDLQKLIDLDSDKTRKQQDRFISRLEGRVEKMYSTEKPDDKKPNQESAAERDARKPRPTADGAPRGGKAPAGTISPYLPDGRTINPAWKAQQNERESLRR
jgi:hypothetical protein